MSLLAALLAAAAALPAPCTGADPFRDGASEWEVTTRIADLEAALDAKLLPDLAEDATAETRRALATERVKTLCALLEAPPREARPANGELLRSILDRPEFANARSRSDDAWKRLLERILAWLEAVFGTRGGAAFSDVYRIAVLALALAVVIAVGLRLSRVRVARTARRARTEAAPLVLEDPAVHLGRAREALAREPREAIREALLCLLSSLERRRWARPDRVKTNRELARELSARGAPPQVASEVTRLLAWYDATFYSLDPVEAEEASRFLREVEGAVALDGGAP